MLSQIFSIVSYNNHAVPILISIEPIHLIFHLILISISSLHSESLLSICLICDCLSRVSYLIFITTLFGFVKIRIYGNSIWLTGSSYDRLLHCPLFHAILMSIPLSIYLHFSTIVEVSWSTSTLLEASTYITFNLSLFSSLILLFQPSVSNLQSVVVNLLSFSHILQSAAFPSNFSFSTVHS